MWDKLKIFYHIVKAGTLTNATALTGLEQSSLTRSLASLEKILGFRLIHRPKPKEKLTLTQQGEIVFLAAQNMFMQAEIMHTRLSEKDGMRGQIRLSTTHAIADYIINPILVEFALKFPDINLEVFCTDSNVNIFKNEVDFAIRPYIESDPTLIQIPLLTFQAGFYASPEYLKEYGTPKTLKDLDDHRLLSFSRPSENPYAQVDWMLKLGREGRKKRRPFYSINSVESLLAAGEKGMGIVTCHEIILKGRTTNLVPLLTDIKSEKNTSYLIYPKNLANVEKIEALKEFILEKV